MKLNIGCGPKWKENYPDYDGLDIINYGQKWVGDIIKFFDIETFEGQRFASNDKDYDEIMANHFLEHFDQDQLKKIFNGVYTFLKVGGTFKFAVPHKKTESAWLLSHKTFWNEETIKWLEREGVDMVYGFGRWKLLEVTTNKRGDIHARLKKI